MRHDTKKIIIYTDGGARGNPGPAAIGVVVADANGRVMKQYGEYLGEATNNEAEYQAVIFALKKLKLLVGKKKTKTSHIEVRSDSELLVSQLMGNYKIKEPRIAKLFIEIWNLKVDFGSVNFVHVPRGENTGADRLVNEALDRESSKLF